MSRADLEAGISENQLKAAKAKEVEGNYEGNTRDLAQLKNEQVQAFFQSQQPVADSLQSVGGGGGVGQSDMLSVAKKSATLLEQILRAINGTQTNGADDKPGATGNFSD
jgi:hypothetical protein